MTGVSHVLTATKLRGFMADHDLAGPSDLHRLFVFGMGARAPKYSTVYSACMGLRPLPTEAWIYLMNTHGLKLKWKEVLPVEFRGAQLKSVQMSFPAIREQRR